MAEAFVGTLKRNYVRVKPRPDAQTVIEQLPGWLPTTTRCNRIALWAIVHPTSTSHKPARPRQAFRGQQPFKDRLLETAATQMLTASSDEIRLAASSDADFVAALHAAFPETAQHIGFDMFDPAWVRRYGRQILRVIGHLKEVESWSWSENIAAGVAAGAISSDLLNYLKLPQSSSTAALALIIIIAKGLHGRDN